MRVTHLALIGAVLFVTAACGGSENEASTSTTSSSTTAAVAIDGVETKTFPAGKHVGSTQRVAYDTAPPFGGPHDQVWATCTGIVYPKAVRTENMVHSLEHGAVWIAYNPDDVSEADIDALSAKVDGTPYMLMSPYPGIDTPISLQAWGARLKLASADDPRIDQFIATYRLSKSAPEPGASCAALPQYFDPDNPPPFDPSPPPADAVPMG